MESGVNLVAALVAVWALTLADRPADADHGYGHSKAEYIASAVEGIMILIAAVSIGWAAVDRMFHPRALEQVWLGLAISLVAAGINGGVALILLRAGNRLRSITLRADAHHLLTDVWTSGGVVVGVVLVASTGWLILDPLIALLVAANIVWAAIRILRDTANGVLDRALPAADQACIASILTPYAAQGVAFHALRTRVAGQRRFGECSQGLACDPSRAESDQEICLSGCGDRSPLRSAKRSNLLRPDGAQRQAPYASGVCLCDPLARSGAGGATRRQTICGARQRRESAEWSAGTRADCRALYGTRGGSPADE
jgi:cation diffusion facilitator family transporter